MTALHTMIKSTIGLMLGMVIGIIIGGLLGLASTGPMGVIGGMALGAIAGAMLGSGIGLRQSVPIPAPARQNAYNRVHQKGQPAHGAVGGD